MKIGDLVIIINDDPGFEENIGKIAMVADFEDNIEAIIHCDSPIKCHNLGLPGTVVDYSSPGEDVWIAKRYLKPLRDSDGTDETLQWQPVPSTLETAE